ncbi:BRO family protein [Delftia tsuruhatensis]|uniref:BRO-N domain-containing protein n=1 Tax=Delftia tsuruhatensis TaxID=180282 RepID=UPI0024442B93|nr:BRO family protein [Delftia tsuruhatensis]MDH0776366.1 BRO family protein [Delftia tsuruhatensis]MDH1460079.1 BRO family protein [Delftia tsuruhatensis]MDH1823042.1 BRO family protein [Delftia tsuruhatensis]WGG12248.1 BRO family protein [Delftia tsuruhatensis]
MSNITPYLFQKASLRVIDDGAGSFEVVAKDVAEALGYTWQSNVIAHVPEEWKGVKPINTPGGPQQMVTLLESGLYFFLGRSDKPDALPMQKWVSGEVLPSIRKTGSYSLAPRSPGEILMLQAQAFYQLEQAQAKISADMQRLETQVEDLAESRVWDQCPQNCEPITKIRIRMNERYGLPDWVVDTVVWKLPLSPKPHGMVRNHREEANGSQYAVYAVADITRVFAQFVDECVQETAMRASHRHIGRLFQLLRNGKKPRALKAHAQAEPA